jgi:hypothetical protein
LTALAAAVSVAGKLVCGEDRCLRQLAVTATVIRAVDRSGQYQLGRYQRDDGKACDNKSGKRRQPFTVNIVPDHVPSRFVIG